MKTEKPEPPKEQDVPQRLCCECGKRILDGYYGRYGDGGVCSKTCSILHMKKREGEP